MFDRHVQIYVALEEIHQLLCPFIQCLPINEAVFFLITSYENIFYASHIAHQRKLLMNNGDSPALRFPYPIGRYFNRFTLDKKFTLCHTIFTGNALGQGGFSRAVFTYQSMTLTRHQGKIYIIQRFNPRKLHCTVSNLNQRSYPCLFVFHFGRSFPYSHSQPRASTPEQIILSSGASGCLIL